MGFHPSVIFLTQMPTVKVEPCKPPQLPANITQWWKLLRAINTLAYWVTLLIMIEKHFIEEALWLLR
jgi:hypothetical protein